MRGLVVPAYGAAPEVRAGLPDPVPAGGEVLVEVSAAGVNPVDHLIASGRFYGPAPPPPYVAGAEAVGRVRGAAHLPEGTRVWALCTTGGIAERVTAPRERVLPLPDGIGDATAVALGVAGLAGWLAVGPRGGLSAGETVLVLGATGVVGQVALLAAAALGAGRVVAAGRDPAGLARAGRLGAHAVVPLGAGDAAAQIRDACGDGADLVVDCLWGAPLVAALASVRRGGRIVQVGNAAGPTADLPAGPLRGGHVEIRGLSVFSVDPPGLADAHAALCAAAGRGEVAVEVDEVPLARAAEAFSRQASGAGGRKLVVTP